MGELIETYGYAAVFLGTFFEGETILVLAGLAAYRGYLDIWTVMGAALAGSFLGDQALYYAGRHWGDWLLGHVPSWRARIDKALRLVHRYQVPFILGFRFIYGVRTVSSLAIGIAGVRPLRFLTLNFVSAAAWSAVIGGLGYAFGEAFEMVVGRLKHYEHLAFGIVIAGGFLVWLWHVWLRRRRRNAKGGVSPPP
jgi:membrane protein DedA with SNARE-associated domain